MKKAKSLDPVRRSLCLFLTKVFTAVILICFITGGISTISAQMNQTRTVSGVVVDSNGEPVPGASVIVKGTTIGQNTDINGRFTLAVPVDANTLVVSFIGMKQAEFNITGQSTVSVQLEDETVGLEEVVVVGYGTQKKVTVTGSVATVSSTQLVAVPVANVSTMLVGQSAGLLAVQRSGEPGEDQALLRIRGVSTFQGSQQPLIMVDGIEALSFNNIDPNEIENIAILKDASATAVYGIRGANGVLIITTKRGKVGKPQISFSTNLAVNQFVEYRKRMRSYDYAWGWNEALKYDSYITGAYVPKFTDEDIEAWRLGNDPIFHPDIDWLKLMLKDYSIQNQQNITIRGGLENVKYFISFGHFHQGGIENNTDLQPGFFDYQTKYSRYNFRANFDFKVTKRLSAVVNLADMIEEKKGMSGEDASSWMRSISLANPLASPGIVDGKMVLFQIPFALNGTPLQNMYNAGYMHRYQNYLNGSIRFNYDLSFVTKGLSWHGTVSFQNYNTSQLNYNKAAITYTLMATKAPDGSPIIVNANTDGPFSTSESVDKLRQTYVEIGLDYTRTFGDHTISGLLLYNQGKKFDPGAQYVIPEGIQGLVGRVSYDYKNRYLAEFNMGYNGTENFAPGNRFGFFPAYSLGWVVSEESFFPKNNILTFLKIRGSYGVVGNDKIGGDRFLYKQSAWNYISNSYYFGLVGISSFAYRGAYEGKIGNPGIAWERAKKTNVGAEISMFRDKLKVSGDYFYERRDNILALPQTKPILTGAGDNMPAQNLGKMENSGFDGEARLNLKAGRFNYWIAGNFTYAHNKILYRDEVYNPYSYQYRTGQRNDQFYGPVEIEGLYNSWMDVSDAYRPFSLYQNNRIQPGDIHWKDINGDGVYDQYDTGPVGYSDFPEKSFGFSFGGNYRGFDFSVMFQGAADVSFDGMDKYNAMWNNNQANSEFFLNRWTLERYQEGLPIYFPRYFEAGGSSTTATQKGTYFVMDARYIRLRNAELGYTVPKNSFFTKLGLASARVYINGSNLFVYAPVMRKKYPGVDPEFKSSYEGSLNREPYPKTRTINFGANLTF